MNQIDPKIVALEQQVRQLQEQVQRLTQQLSYLDRERIRSKNEISQVANEVRTRRS
jgi:flagellar biosynthesis/type III secretory pathway chaperone